MIQHMTTMSDPHPLALQMLAWLAARPRTYRETMDAWRTSCPRFSTWEDALSDRLIRVGRSDGAPGLGRPMVELTTEGRAILDRFGQP
jgi:hypothetical protein